jgi:pyruvate ferredoxin oxidoreductase gamma subunit
MLRNYSDMFLNISISFIKNYIKRQKLADTVSKKRFFMAKEIFEIKIIGRGGQGGKTAAEILAMVAMLEGKFVQSFPEFGAERKGAPVMAYTRISSKEIRIHTGVTNPDVVAVIDETLIKAFPITSGLGNNGMLIINTTKSPDSIKNELGFRGRVYWVDASKIALETLGSPHTNTAMLGAIAKATGMFKLESINEEVKEKFLRKIGEKGVEKNLKAIERAYNEVKECKS